MKTIYIAAILVLLYLANSPETQEARIPQRKIINRVLSAYLNEEEATENTSNRQEPTARLRHETFVDTRIKPVGLQSGNGLQLGARSMTPADEWNQTFKRKE